MLSLVFDFISRYLLCTNGMPLRVSRRGFKVALVGSGTAVGQKLSLLLKQNPLIEQLHLHDMTASLTALEKDLSDICTKAKIKCFVGHDQLVESLTDANIVVFAEILPEKPHNAYAIAGITSAVSVACPKALLAFVTSPINFVVPMAAEFLKAQNTYDPRRLFGVTTLNSMRIETYISDVLNVNPSRVSVPVIGGFSEDTALPILTQCSCDFGEEFIDLKALNERIENSDYDAFINKAPDDDSKANAASSFIDSLLRGLNGEPDVIQCSFVGYEAPLCPFFATRVILGPEGIQTNLGLPPLETCDKEILDLILPSLLEDINVGIFMAKKTIDRYSK